MISKADNYAITFINRHTKKATKEELNSRLWRKQSASWLN
jgi:hypothetical protein